MNLVQSSCFAFTCAAGVADGGGVENVSDDILFCGHACEQVRVTSQWGGLGWSVSTMCRLHKVHSLLLHDGSDAVLGLNV